MASSPATSSRAHTCPRCRSAAVDVVTRTKLRARLLYVCRACEQLFSVPNLAEHPPAVSARTFRFISSGTRRTS